MVIKSLLADAYSDWSQDEVPRMGAALAYYTVLSLAPLLIIAIAIAGFAFGREAVQGQIMSQLGGQVGPQAADAIQSMIRGAGSQKSTGVIATVLGAIALLFGATSLVSELRADMNKIWKVPALPDEGIEGEVKQRLYAFAIVLGSGFLLLVALILSTALQATSKYFGDVLPIPGFALQIINDLVALAVITVLFAALFKVLPRISLDWKDVWLGAAFTAILFSIGKILIGLYLGRAGFGSTFGAAGSLIILLVWIYYSAQIFFFGVEFTQVYARTHGSDANRRQGSKAPAPHEPSQVESYAMGAASGNAALPPVHRSQRKNDDHPTLAGNLGAIAGLMVDTGKRIIRVIKS